MRLVEPKRKKELLLPLIFLIIIILVGILSIFFDFLQYVFTILLGIEVIILGFDYKKIKNKSKYFYLYMIVGILTIALSVVESVMVYA
ncbi:MAG: hypothetical protein R3Y21_05050 [Mycoplasmatota bacterium]